MGYTDVLFQPTRTAYTDIMRQVEQEQELRRSTRSRRILNHPFDFFGGTAVLPQLPPPVLSNSNSNSHRSEEEEMDDDDAAAALLLHQALTQADAGACSPTTPLNADKLLAQELNSLSMVDRERVYDEIHGIQPPNRPRPTPSQQPGGESVLSTSQNSSNTGWESSCSGTTSVSSLSSVVEEQRQHDAEEEALLCQFQDAVETLLRAASTAASSSQPAVASYPAYRYANFHGSHLLRDRQFQLSFLKTESQHPRKAALRFLKHLEAIHHVFETPAVLFRPIQLLDLEPATTKNTTEEELPLVTNTQDPGEEGAAEAGTASTVLPAAAITKKTTSTKKNKRKNKKRTSTTGTTKPGRTGRRIEENDTSRTLSSKGVYTGKRLLVEHGFLQLLPVRDTSGRRILCHFREPPTVASNVKARVRDTLRDRLYRYTTASSCIPSTSHPCGIPFVASRIH